MHNPKSSITRPECYDIIKCLRNSVVAKFYVTLMSSTQAATNTKFR
jgi:hypothetical protein